MSSLLRCKLFLWYFSHFKVAMIGYLRPRLLTLNDTDLVICLPLRRRSRNHLRSMYFGALAVGADLAGGFHAFYHADALKCKISLAFKSFEAQFLRRPEADVYFVCKEGEAIKAMLEESRASGERINKPVHITAYTHYPEKPEEVAQFVLELSVKVVK